MIFAAFMIGVLTGLGIAALAFWWVFIKGELDLDL